MAADELGPFGLLEPQPLRFDAPVSLNALYAQALTVVHAATGKRAFVRTVLGIDTDALSSLGMDEASELATRVAFQTLVANERLALNVFSPLGGRYFKLPKHALMSPFSYVMSIEGQPVADDVRHVPELPWATGQLSATDCDPSIEALGRLGVRISVSSAAQKAALREIRLMLAAGRSASGGYSDADNDAAVDATLDKLLAARGRLSLNEGASLLKAVHPTRTRDQLRERVRAKTKPTRPGPVGPRK